jgi:hypothetical protein
LILFDTLEIDRRHTARNRDPDGKPRPYASRLRGQPAALIQNLRSKRQKACLNPVFDARQREIQFLI